MQKKKNKTKKNSSTRFLKVMIFLSFSLLHAVDRHLSFESASLSHSSIMTLKLSKLYLQTSVKHSPGRPRLRLPSINSLYSIGFGIRSSDLIKK